MKITEGTQIARDSSISFVFLVNSSRKFPCKSKRQSQWQHYPESVAAISSFSKNHLVCQKTHVIFPLVIVLNNKIPRRLRDDDKGFNNEVAPPPRAVRRLIGARGQCGDPIGHWTILGRVATINLSPVVTSPHLSA